MDSIIDKAKRGISEGFEKFLRKTYDGQAVVQEEIEYEDQAVESNPIIPAAADTSVSIERPIVDEKPVVKAYTLPPITWHILRCKYKRGGVKVWLVIIVSGNVKREFEAAEWLKRKDYDQTLACFIAAVVNAVRPDAGFESRLLESLDYSQKQRRL